MRPTVARLTILTSWNEKRKWISWLSSFFRWKRQEPYLRNNSPGYCMYMTSLFVHSWWPCLSTSPPMVPPSTPITVRMVSMLFRRNPRNPLFRWSVIVARSWSRSLPGRPSPVFRVTERRDDDTHAHVYRYVVVVDLARQFPLTTYSSVDGETTCKWQKADLLWILSISISVQLFTQFVSVVCTGNMRIMGLWILRGEYLEHLQIYVANDVCTVSFMILQIL